MEEHHSILYEPVNRLLIALLGEPPVAKVEAVSPALAHFLFPAGTHAWIPDAAIMVLLLLLFFVTFFPIVSRRYSKTSPSKTQTFLEAVVSFLRGMIDEAIGHGSERKYLPIFGAFFVFIAAANLMGVFFFLQPPTGAISTTVALALVSFVYFNHQGIREHGVLGYLKHFLGPMLLIAPMFFVIEIIGTFARILSLSLRLFMNIAGEHATVGVFSSLVPILVPLPIMALGLFTALLQAYVFTILSTTYVGIATAHEEH
jgi:F-type H+-transporting ATPase subunit a